MSDEAGGSEPAGLYVHVPFCHSKCPYCDFYSEVDSGLRDAFVDAALREAQHHAARRGPFDTLYLGGGTPSVLSPDELCALVEGLRRICAFTSDAEITLEVNPDDVTPTRAKLWRELGMNRLSVGVQSFQDDELRFLGRRHTAHSALRALEAVRDHGPSNLSVDLIYGFCGQTAQSLRSTIDRVFTFAPDHLSSYQLTLEPRTVFGQRHARGELRRLDEEEERSYFLIVADAIRSRDFDHYEISNFARASSMRSRHNQKYWQHTETIGLGPAAHSYRDGCRRWNVTDVAEYIERVRGRGDSTVGSESLTEIQIRLETLLLGLRTADGVSVDFVKTLRRGEDIVAALVREGLVTVGGGRVMPTLDGFLLADGLPLRFDLE
jgi:putative oxygen-independent coproporphyrinogen III oxidase